MYLTSPHLIVYDATLLALPLVWLGAWAKTQANAKEYALAVGLLFVALALPWSSLTRIRPSVVVMLWIAHQVWRSVRRIPDVPTGVSSNPAGCERFDKHATEPHYHVTGLATAVLSD